MQIFQARTLDDLPNIAENIKDLVQNKRIIAFYGKMGVGKTTFIKALCDAFKVNNLVNSPTFALINEYFTEDAETIYHFDFYRINKLEEIYDVGFDEYVQSGNICFMEWPELIEPALPEGTLKIKIELQDDNSRLITVLN